MKVRLEPVWKQGELVGAFVPIPDEICRQLGWKVGDNIEITMVYRQEVPGRDSTVPDHIRLQKVK